MILIKLLICTKQNKNNLSWSENFRMVDIEINDWSPLFLNLKTIVILCLCPEKCIKFNQSELGIRIWNFCTPFNDSSLIYLRLIYTHWRGSLIFKNRYLVFSTTYKKSGLSKKLKVSTLDIPIKQSGLKVSHSKVLNSENFRMVDIEINAWSSLFHNSKTNLILYLYPKSV